MQFIPIMNGMVRLPARVSTALSRDIKVCSKVITLKITSHDRMPTGNIIPMIWLFIIVEYHCRYQNWKVHCVLTGSVASKVLQADYVRWNHLNIKYQWYLWVLRKGTCIERDKAKETTILSTIIISRKGSISLFLWSQSSCVIFFLLLIVFIFGKERTCRITFHKNVRTWFYITYRRITCRKSRKNNFEDLASKLYITVSCPLAKSAL